MRVSVGCDNFENAVVQLENRNVEGTTAEIVNDDDAVLFLVQTVGQRRGRRFIYQPQNIQSGDATRVFCGLALRVIEICGDGDDRLRDLRPEKTFGIALQLAQDQRRNLRRIVAALANLDAQYFARLKVFRQAEW